MFESYLFGVDFGEVSIRKGNPKVASSAWITWYITVIMHTKFKFFETNQIDYLNWFHSFNDETIMNTLTSFVMNLSSPFSVRSRRELERRPTPIVLPGTSAVEAEPGACVGWGHCFHRLCHWCTPPGSHPQGVPCLYCHYCRPSYPHGHRQWPCPCT